MFFSNGAVSKVFKHTDNTDVTDKHRFYLSDNQ